MTEAELIELLADKEHASWSHWMKYLFSKCHRQDDGAVVIPADLAQRWEQQAQTDYGNLSEQEKQSDRDEVMHILQIIRDFKAGLPAQEQYDYQSSNEPIIDGGPFPMTREEAKASLKKLQSLGFIGESRIVSGQKQFLVGPEHIAMMKRILSHPEKWPADWSNERRAQWQKLRKQAIEKGFIQP